MFIYENVLFVHSMLQHMRRATAQFCRKDLATTPRTTPPPRPCIYVYIYISPSRVVIYIYIPFPLFSKSSMCG